MNAGPGQRQFARSHFADCSRTAAVIYFSSESRVEVFATDPISRGAGGSGAAPACKFRVWPTDQSAEMRDCATVALIQGGVPGPHVVSRVGTSKIERAIVIVDAQE